MISIKEIVYEGQQSNTPYDSHIVKEILAQSKRYKEYEYLKKIAILRISENFKNQLSIFSQMIEIKENDTKPMDELSHNIFSWKWSDFLKRRSLKSFVWVDVLLRMKENRLHLYKLQKDLEELLFFLEKIFGVFFSNDGEQDIDINQHIEKPIDEAKTALHTIDYVEHEFYNNSQDLKHLIYKEHFFINAKRNSEERLLRDYLENRIWNSHIWDPIEIRYRINWYHNVAKQNQYHVDSAVGKYETDIASHCQMLNMEKFINDNCMDYCYSSIEVYKNRITEIQNKFDEEYDNIENKLTSMRLQIDKLRDQRKWLSLEIERFHEEEEKMRVRIERERDREQQKQRNETEPVKKKVNRKKTAKNKIRSTKPRPYKPALKK